MKLLLQKLLPRKSERGQMLIMFVLFLVVLILFLGLAIDLGFAYSTRAELSKAVDAAALAGVNNLAQGTLTASSVASATFAANYGRPGRDIAAIIPVTNFGTENGNLTVSVDAATTINTFFIRVLPSWKTMTVKAAAQATRSKLIMSLVLDRSGSMEVNGGAAQMTRAVTNFINHFDDKRDRVALVTYASDARVDVPISLTIGTPFKQPIINATRAIYINNAQVVGATFSPGGLTNALQQNSRPTVASGENVNRVVVFFTDGFANTIQETLTCPSPTLYNFGGNAPSENGYIAFMNPNTGAERCGSSAPNPNSAVTLAGCSPSCNATTFRSAINGSQKTFTRNNITADSEFRCIQLARAMRQANTTVFCIGLGNDDDINKDFLRELANDPTGPNHNPNLPVGEAVFAATPNELKNVFEIIAQRILLRLTR